MTISFRRNLPLSLALALLYSPAMGIAAEQEQRPEPDSSLVTAEITPQSASPENQMNAFSTMQLQAVSEGESSDGGNELRLVSPPDMEEMRRRLKDPEQRAQLRATHRASTREQHPELVQALTIDSATAEKLIDLLTDRQMQGLDQFYNHASRNGTDGVGPTAFEDSLQANADAETRRLEQLRELLGEEGLDRYQSYSTTLGERMQVNRFDARLERNHKLRPDQKDRLILLIQEQYAQERQAIARPLRWLVGLPQPQLSQDELAQHSLRQTIEANEEALRSMQKSAPVLLQRASQVLTAVQLTAFSQMNAEKISGLRKWIEQARVQAELNPEIPEHRAASPEQAPAPTPIVGDVRFEISLTVNGEPTTVTHIGPNGEPTEFQAAGGLFVQATPTLFDDHWLDVQLSYFEQGRTGKRRLDSTSNFGVLTRSPDGTPSQGGGSMMVVTGRKGYLVIANVRAATL